VAPLPPPRAAPTWRRRWETFSPCTSLLLLKFAPPKAPTKEHTFIIYRIQEKSAGRESLRVAGSTSNSRGHRPDRPLDCPEVAIKIRPLPGASTKLPAPPS